MNSSTQSKVDVNVTEATGVGNSFAGVKVDVENKFIPASTF